MCTEEDIHGSQMKAKFAVSGQQKKCLPLHFWLQSWPWRDKVPLINFTQLNTSWKTPICKQSLFTWNGETGSTLIKKTTEARMRREKKRVQRIDPRGLKSNCWGIVFPPFSSSASKLLIDTHVLRPPIPGAHPSVKAASVLKLMPNPPGGDPVSWLNKIISFFPFFMWAPLLIKLHNICKKCICSYPPWLLPLPLLSVRVAGVHFCQALKKKKKKKRRRGWERDRWRECFFNFVFSLQEGEIMAPWALGATLVSAKRSRISNKSQPSQWDGSTCNGFVQINSGYYFFPSRDSWVRNCQL